MEHRLPRKLSAILHADVAGYSRLTEEDEERTHRRLSEYLDLISGVVEEHQGRVVHYAGDAVLADFGTATEALACATSIQHELASCNRDLPDERKVQFRIGVNLGEVIVDRGDIYGDGVNVAARLETLADPGGICISESARSAIGKKLDLVYEFMGEQEVKNIAEPVRAYKVVLEKRDAPTIVLPPALPLGLPNKPSIAVLPFTNMSGDPAQEYFSDGITEDVITNLSKFPELFVTARHSTFTYKEKPTSVQIVGRELGVLYVLEGSVQKANNAMRITAQLSDATTGHHIWAERYDRELEDIFSVRDEVTQSIAATLMGPSGQITKTATQRAARKPTDSLDAYDYFLRGMSYFRFVTESRNAEAGRLFQKTIELDAKCSLGYEGMAWVHANEVVNEWTSDRKKDLDLAYEWAQKAVSLDDSAYSTHWVLGVIYLYRREYAKSEAAYERAQKLNPNDAHLIAYWAEALDYLGRPEQAIVQLKRAMRLNPLYPEWYNWTLGDAYYSAKEYEHAIAWLQKITEPEFEVHLTLTACYVVLRRIREAKIQIKKVLELEPTFSLAEYVKHLAEASPRKYPEKNDEYIGALGEAGLPE